MTRVETAVLFLKGYHFTTLNGSIQVYNTRNVCGDYMENILSENGVYIDYSGNGYIEIFGLTDKEFKEVCETMKGLYNVDKEFYDDDDDDLGDCMCDRYGGKCKKTCRAFNKCKGIK